MRYLITFLFALTGWGCMAQVIPAEQPPATNTPVANIETVYVEGGSFNMGSNYTKDSKPIHRVTVSSFYIGKYDVTQAQWRAVMGNNPSRFKDCDECPVEGVYWIDAQQFIARLNQKTGKHYRLPTEAEWEYAARGGNKSNGYTYSGSNGLASVAWYTDNSGHKTHPVGQKQANELGIYDMTGNVPQWCQDWYDKDYYANSPAENPQGPSFINTNAGCLFRGSHWNDRARDCSVAFRGYDHRGYDGYSSGVVVVGLRLVLVP
jgi:formylglycine-generating enzyme required for sulfatase activity